MVWTVSAWCDGRSLHRACRFHGRGHSCLCLGSPKASCESLRTCRRNATQMPAAVDCPVFGLDREGGHDGRANDRRTFASPGSVRRRRLPPAASSRMLRVDAGGRSSLTLTDRDANRGGFPGRSTRELNAHSGAAASPNERVFLPIIVRPPPLSPDAITTDHGPDCAVDDTACHRDSAS